ncbi:MAG: 2-C-methyl-D-erythritol 4-phosphate cytidylyltransferase, partial [Pseudomonadota bacterium]|nr:2-C-methyl-D-erythritol 4-phosphate cytidylyltransferase [Pseudomonadota bacterium]
MSCAAILVAAGRGERAGGGVPKQYRDLAGKMVLERTLERFLGHPAIDDVVVVINPDDAAFFAGIDAPVLWVNGGATRTASVRAGLAALESRRSEQVLIHDAARPFVSDRVISDVVDALADAPAALPVLPVTDALLAHADGNMCDSVDRDRLRAAQTPQGFRLDALLDAYEKLGDASAHDDASVALAAGLQVHLTRGEAGNFKLTTPEDFERAEALLGKTDMIYVTGQGFDVHRLEPSDHMYLCGVRLDQDFGLVGHSDADVGL